MGLFESLLLSACVTTSGGGSQQMACQKGTEAGAKQSGVSQTVDAFESKETKKLEKNAVELFGKEGVNVVAGSVFVAKTMSSRSLSIGLPTFGMCTSIKTEIKPEYSILKFEWKF